jgi:hypothetical protein
MDCHRGQTYHTKKDCTNHAWDIFRVTFSPTKTQTDLYTKPHGLWRYKTMLLVIFLKLCSSIIEDPNGAIWLGSSKRRHPRGSSPRSNDVCSGHFKVSHNSTLSMILTQCIKRWEHMVGYLASFFAKVMVETMQRFLINYNEQKWVY